MTVTDERQFQEGDRVYVTEGGEHIPTGTFGTITEVDYERGRRITNGGEYVPACRVDWPGCTHKYQGVRGVWVDVPSLRLIEPPERCEACHGTGHFKAHDGYGWIEFTCEGCGGRGEIGTPELEQLTPAERLRGWSLYHQRNFPGRHDDLIQGSHDVELRASDIASVLDELEQLRRKA